MSGKKTVYKVKKKRSLAFRFVKGFLKIFIRRPKMINPKNVGLEKKAIYLMNHSGARGPLVFELYFPVFSTPWGAHEMLGNYRQRWNYLYNVFYRQKLHWGKARAGVVATFFAMISRLIYNGAGLIGTYRDARLIKTIRSSFKVLDEDIAIVINPEDSTNGYLDKTEAFNKGFIALSNLYYKRTGEDLPVYTVYYSREQSKFIVDEPLKVNAMLSQGMTWDEVSDVFLAKSHAMYDEFVAPFEKKKKK